MLNKFRFLTAGESHGKCLTAIIEGIPAGFNIDPAFINEELKRRQSGYGRGERMKIEADTVEITSGVRFGKTLGSPVTLVIQNKDYENWQNIMSVLPEDSKREQAVGEILSFAQNDEKSAVTDQNHENLTNIDTEGKTKKSFTKCRPGHADFAGSVKYNFKDLRCVLERSSARKTAIEVAVGAVAKQILKEFKIEWTSEILQIGNATENFETEIDNAKKEGDTLGGKFKIVYKNLPVGLGSYVHYDRMLDGKIAQAVMSVPAIKSVSIGNDYCYKIKGSQFHDEMFVENGKVIRKTNNAGGIEGGMTNGEPLVVTACMKPIPTLRKPLNTVDLATMEECEAHFERSDTCAVEACAVVAEARIACVLVDELLQKSGGDNYEEIFNNIDFLLS